MKSSGDWNGWQVIPTYLELVDEGMDDVRCATLDVVESTEPLCTLDIPLTVLGGSEPFGVEVLGTAGDGVVWGGVCEVVLLPSGTVGWSMEGVGHLAGNGEHTRNNNLASDERTGHRVQKGREEEKKRRVDGQRR